LTSVGESVADCSRQLVQRTKMHVGPILIVSVVIAHYALYKSTYLLTYNNFSNNN